VERIWQASRVATITERIAVISKESKNAGMSEVLLEMFPALNLSRWPRSFAASLAALPSIPENPFPRFLCSSEIFFMRTERQSWTHPGDD
jgi:hypothetical protein